MRYSVIIMKDVEGASIDDALKKAGGVEPHHVIVTSEGAREHENLSWKEVEDRLRASFEPGDVVELLASATSPYSIMNDPGLDPPQHHLTRRFTVTDQIDEDGDVVLRVDGRVVGWARPSYLRRVDDDPDELACVRCREAWPCTTASFHPADPGGHTAGYRRDFTEVDG